MRYEVNAVMALKQLPVWATNLGLRKTTGCNGGLLDAHARFCATISIATKLSLTFPALLALILAEGAIALPVTLSGGALFAS